MTREEAVKWWREIREGGGVDRGKYRDAVPPGNVAAYLWNEGAFTLGVEYGVMMALSEVFGLSDDEAFKGRLADREPDAGEGIR